MKGGAILLVLIFSFSLASAGFFNTFTGKVIDGLQENISNMSEGELVQLYNKNKGLISNEDINNAIKENSGSIPRDVIDKYGNNSGLSLELPADEESIKEMILKDGNVSLATVLDIFPCSTLVEFIKPQIVGLQVPEEVPLEDDVFNFYIDKDFIASVELDGKNVSDISCKEDKDYSYQIFVTSDLVVDVALNYKKINVINFYKEKKASGDLDIEARGLMNKLKLLVLNIAVKFM